MSLKKACSVLFLFASIWLLTANAVFRSTLDYQGYLTNESGAPVDGPVDIEFSVYDVDAGGIPVWTDARLVTVREGLFNVELGGMAKPFPAGLSETPLWLGVQVVGAEEMLPRRPITSTGLSFRAQDSDPAELRR